MKKHICLIIGAMLLTSTFAVFAHASAKEGGGGDICQDRIEAIRNDISDWIQHGGSASLNFTNSGITLNTYNQRMENVIALTRLNDQTSISCTDDQSVVQIDGVHKTCISYEENNRPQILCYRGITRNGQFVSGFMGLSADDQYFQVHHEIAVLANIEDQAKESSDYPLSDQITSYLQEQIVKKLALKPVNKGLRSMTFMLEFNRGDGTALGLTRDGAKYTLLLCGFSGDLGQGEAAAANYLENTLNYTNGSVATMNAASVYRGGRGDLAFKKPQGWVIGEKYTLIPSYVAIGCNK